MTDDQIKAMIESANRRFDEWRVEENERRDKYNQRHEEEHMNMDAQMRSISRRQERYCNLMVENNRILSDVACSLRVLSGRQHAD